MKTNPQNRKRRDSIHIRNHGVSFGRLRKSQTGHSSHEIYFDAALRPPLVSLREGIDTDIDDISMDRTSDIIADGVAIAFDEDDAAERDDTRIHGGMPLAGESA